MFIWSLFSSFLVHSLAALVALCKLYQHPIGRFYPVLIFLMGIVSPLTGRFHNPLWLTVVRELEMNVSHISALTLSYT